MAHARCRSCGADILWIPLRSGKTMPCDPEPQFFAKDPRGTHVYVTPEGDVLRGSPQDYGIRGYTSHFATCPYADRHRNSGHGAKE